MITLTLSGLNNAGILALSGMNNTAIHLVRTQNFRKANTRKCTYQGEKWWFFEKINV